MALKADISDTESVQQLVDAAVERFGRLDVVVANAAASAFKPLMDIRAHHIEKTMGITIQGFLDLVRISLPHMRNGGRVLAVSGWDSFRALPLHGLLGAAKAGMESIVRNLAVELAGDGVTAVGVCPGPIDTDSFRLYAGESWDDYAKNWLTQTPSGAYPTPSEVADVMAFLCSPEQRRDQRPDHRGRRWPVAWPPCRSDSGRTDDEHTVVGGRADRRAVDEPGPAATRPRDRGGGGGPVSGRSPSSS